MHPFILETWFGQSLSSYGVLASLGLVLGYLQTLTLARGSLSQRDTERLFLGWVLGALVGSRLFHVFFERWNYFLSQPDRIFALWEGGFSLYGGLSLGLAVFFCCTRYQGLSFLRAADLFTPGALLGLALGRLGCFMAGCCWGKPTGSAWGVVQTHARSVCPYPGVALTPVALLEAAGVFLLYFFARRSLDKSPRGNTFFVGLAGYALLRFFMEFLRADPFRGFPQWLWAACAATAIAMLVTRLPDLGASPPRVRSPRKDG